MGVLNFPYQSLTESDLSFLVQKYNELQEAFDTLRTDIADALIEIEEFRRDFQNLDTIVQTKMTQYTSSAAFQADLTQKVEAASEEQYETISGRLDEIEELLVDVPGEISGNFGNKALSTTNTITAGSDITSTGGNIKATNGNIEAIDGTFSGDVEVEGVVSADSFEGTASEVAATNNTASDLYLLGAMAQGVEAIVPIISGFKFTTDGNITINGKVPDYSTVEVDTSTTPISSTPTMHNSVVTIGNLKIYCGFVSKPLTTNDGATVAISYSDMGFDDFAHNTLFAWCSIYKTSNIVTSMANNYSASGFDMYYNGHNFNTASTRAISVIAIGY